MNTPNPCVRSLLGIILLAAWAVSAQPLDPETLCLLTPGRTRAENALWIENPLSARFNNSKRVVVAEIRGPAVITMIHFALPQSHFGQPVKLLNRDLLLRCYWDGETTPSVEVPLVDFFCDPAGLREEVNTALVNKRRGFNAYFPMPFRRSGKVELVYDGPVEPGDELWRLMPCYSYVMYRTLHKLPKNSAFFHASWHQESLLLGQRDYLALDAKGRGKFVGWNVTVRLPGRDGYPVDMNEKFYIDGESSASIEFQGIEDSFGFSWGFPPTESQFPMTGFYKFFKGAMGYRFFGQDAIHFEKSLKVGIGFGQNEDPMFRREFSKPGNALQLSSTVYWYQQEPHASLPRLLPPSERAPAPEEPFWPEKEELPAAEELRQRHVRLHMRCGRSQQEVIYAERGYNARVIEGYAFEGWPPPVYHCRAGNEFSEIELDVPPAAQGTVRLFVIDPDHFEGGRKQTVSVEGKSLGLIEDFVEGRWLETKVGSSETSDGKLAIRASNARKGANAVLSIIEWIGE
jgi:hypothetical protein